MRKRAQPELRPPRTCRVPYYIFMTESQRAFVTVP